MEKILMLAGSGIGCNLYCLQITYNHFFMLFEQITGYLLELERSLKLVLPILP